MFIIHLPHLYKSHSNNILNRQTRVFEQPNHIRHSHFTGCYIYIYCLCWGKNFFWATFSQIIILLISSGFLSHSHWTQRAGQKLSISFVITFLQYDRPTSQTKAEQSTAQQSRADQLWKRERKHSNDEYESVEKNGKHFPDNYCLDYVHND